MAAKDISLSTQASTRMSCLHHTTTDSGKKVSNQHTHVLGIIGLTRFNASVNITLRCFYITGLSVACPELSVEGVYSKNGNSVIEVWAGNIKIKRIILNKSTTSSSLWTMRSRFELSVVALRALTSFISY